MSVQTSILSFFNKSSNSSSKASSNADSNVSFNKTKSASKENSKPVKHKFGLYDLGTFLTFYLF